MDNYTPELGQFVNGQPWQQFNCPEDLTQALQAIRDTMEVFLLDSPFHNNGTTFKNDVFEVHAYSWSDEEQPYNFKWRDIEVSWYKHLTRGTTVNREVAQHEVMDLLKDCLKSLI